MDFKFRVEIKTSNNEDPQPWTMYEDEDFKGRVYLGDILMWDTEITATIHTPNALMLEDSLKEMEQAVFNQFAAGLSMLMAFFIKRTD